MLNTSLSSSTVTKPLLPPLNTLRAFEAAARLGSFAKAAQELNLTAAAISHRIKALENRVDVPLFVRQARGVILTEAGKRYHERLSDIFNQITEATRALGQQAIEGPLTLSAPHSFIQHWLIPRLEGLYARHPGLILTLRGESQLLSFRDHQADIGIRFGTGQYPGLYVEQLMTDSISVMAPARLAQRLSDIRPTQLMQSQLLLEDSSVQANEPWNTWQPWFREAGVTLEPSQPRLLFSDSGLVLNACADGLGICLCRHSIASRLLSERKVHAILPWRSHEFAYYLVSHPSEVNNPRIQAFREWLLQEIEDFQHSSGNSLDAT